LTDFIINPFNLFFGEGYLLNLTNLENSLQNKLHYSKWVIKFNTANNQINSQNFINYLTKLLLSGINKNEPFKSYFRKNHESEFENINKIIDQIIYEI
jgi:hypothetical protein